jgi:hypothetical protein
MTEALSTDLQLPDELSVLKDRARMMGITFSNNIGLDALRAKVKAAQEGEDNEDARTEDDNGEDEAEAPSDRLINPDTKLVIPSSERIGKETKAEALARFRTELLNEQMRLIRIRVQNLNPLKAEVPGEILTVANEFIGTVRKYIPYGEATDDGYHVPYCLLLQMQERKFQHITTTKDRKTGSPVVNTRWTKEFAIEILPPLTKEELKQLAQAQIAAGSVDNKGSDGTGESF